MLEQATDFLAESEALSELVSGLSAEAMGRPTAFKGWTIDNVIRHLHVWNHGADLSLTDPEAFQSFYAQVGKRIAEGSITEFETAFLDGLAGPGLVDTWRTFYREMAARFGAADPALRVKWAGPDMSVRSSITARLMETWAHGQEVYDELGVVRRNEDRIRNIVVLGNNTYGWTFHVRGETPPEPVPHLELTAPSGAVWRYNPANDLERIAGLAEEFCQVVTQVRNIEDTALSVQGPNALNWMSKAQCFAGPPESPPPPGTRRTRAPT